MDISCHLIDLSVNTLPTISSGSAIPTLYCLVKSKFVYKPVSSENVFTELFSTETQQYLSVTANSSLKLRYFISLLIKYSIIFSNSA